MYDLLAIIIGGVDCRIGSLEIEVLCAKLIK